MLCTRIVITSLGMRKWCDSMNILGNRSDSTLTGSSGLWIVGVEYVFIIILHSNSILLIKGRADWHILNADRFPVSRKFTNMKCNNCCEFGHHRNKCPLPRKDLTCFVCGDVGHKEPRCPNAVCLRVRQYPDLILTLRITFCYYYLQCGKKTNVFTRSCQNCIMENSKICPICKIRGHSIDLCPDKWRRYHSTVILFIIQ